MRRITKLQFSKSHGALTIVAYGKSDRGSRIRLGTEVIDYVSLSPVEFAGAKLEAVTKLLNR